MGYKYVFDGGKLTEKNKTTTLASVRGNKIYAKTSSITTANIKGNKIFDKNSGTNVVANVRIGNLCTEGGSSKICKMKEIDNLIDGPKGAIKAALWFYFIN